MNYYVYETTNLINNKKYIGKRACNCDIEKDKYLGSGYALINAIKKYGKENFSKKVLYVCSSEEEAFEIERKIILDRNAHVNREEYYNIAQGGRGFTSEEVRNLWKNDEIREKFINRLNGSTNPKAKKIICLNNLKIFETIRDASIEYEIGESEICAICHNRYNSVISKKIMKG